MACPTRRGNSPRNLFARLRRSRSVSSHLYFQFGNTSAARRGLDANSWLTVVLARQKQSASRCQTAALGKSAASARRYQAEAATDGLACHGAAMTRVRLHRKKDVPLYAARGPLTVVQTRTTQIQIISNAAAIIKETPMNISEKELEQRLASRLMDVLIRAALLFTLALLCYRIFEPFLSLMVWASILAVTLYPVHRALASKLGQAGTCGNPAGDPEPCPDRRSDRSADQFLGDSVHDLVTQVRDNTLKVPPPRESPLAVVGARIHTVWSKAYSDLPALVQSLQPKIGELTKAALSFVAGIGLGILQFIASLIIAGILMALASPARKAAWPFSRGSRATSVALHSPSCRHRRSALSPRVCSVWH